MGHLGFQAKRQWEPMLIGLAQVPRSAEHNPLLVRGYDFFSHYKWAAACQVLTGFMTCEGTLRTL